MMSNRPWPLPLRGPALELGALGALGLFTLLSVAGYAVFARNPHLVPPTDFAARFYAVSYALLARLHIALSALVLALFLIRRAGFRWLPALGAVYLGSFLSEHVGTGYGFPFGDYQYTGLLGWKLGGRVPALIPLSWFLMVVPSWAMAHRLFPGPRGTWRRVLMGSYFLTVWDLALDPAMSFLTPYWVWKNPGLYYGMPWINLAGWFFTGVVLMALLEALKVTRWGSSLEFKWLASYYGVVLFMPLGMVAAAHLWPAVGATLAGVLLPWGIRGVRSFVRSLGTPRREPALLPAEEVL